MVNYKHAEMTDEQLKQIAKDLYNGLIFCDRQIKDASMLGNYFMPLIFMAPKAPSHEKGSDLKETRQKKIEYLKVAKQLDREYERQCKEYDEFLENIGLVYEYYSNSQSPVSLNGLPMFFSCQIMSKKDAERMFEFYEKYKSIREMADDF